MFLFDFSSQETAQIMDANGTTGEGFKTFVWKLTLLQLWSSGALTSPRRWTLPTSEQRSTFPRARSQDFADTGQVVSKIVATVSDSRPIQKNRPQGPIPLTWVGFTMISIVFYLLTMVASISFNSFDSRFCSWSCQHLWFNRGAGKGVRCSFPKFVSRFASLGCVERFAWWTKGLPSNSSNQLPWLLEETSQTKCRVQHRCFKRNITTRAQFVILFRVLSEARYTCKFGRGEGKNSQYCHICTNPPTGQGQWKIIWTRCICTMSNC